MPSPSDDAYAERVATVLLVDDDPTVRGVVSDYLRAAGHEVIEVGDGVAALGRAEGCDLIILDLMLPGIDGHEVFRRLRSAGVGAPVIMLTAKSSEADRVLGLELGADDYLAKPFSPRELVLRVGAVLRRQQPAAPGREVIADGPLTLDLTAQKATLDGRPLNLTFREFDLLAHLVSHPDEVFSRDDLMRAVWGWDVGDASTVTVHVRRVRSKIEPDPQCPTRLVTVWGRGYRWEPHRD
ncbi:DNA-binding response regulator [Arachnia propionica]|uniref:DNA-binding response regulator n=1 Tax=Arachnia propionica TaxID=1750 RepID=A0A3P1WRM2_9ACTN|nr:DNA-binding response regulator [Arachnia propionica]